MSANSSSPGARFPLLLVQAYQTSKWGSSSELTAADAQMSITNLSHITLVHIESTRSAGAGFAPADRF
jgi:hypothetical protein